MRVVAFAGRRVDAESAGTPRFPPTAVDAVAARIRGMLQALEATAIVASAAAGADLLALREAGALALHRRVVLPVPPAQFVERSVADRPGPWVPLFEEIVGAVSHDGDLVVLDAGSGHPGYVAATRAIVAEAQAIAAARGAGVAALVAWDGEPRGRDDLTDAFRRFAAEQGLPVHEVLTL